jgi:hypothetical protein
MSEQDAGRIATTINRLVAENTNLRRKLQTQPVIEQAKGILMATHGVSADEAFQILSKRSQDSNTKLHLVALSVTANRGQDHQPDSMTGRGSRPAAASTVSLGPTRAPHQQHRSAVIPVTQTGTLVTTIDRAPATAESLWDCLLPGEVMDALAEGAAAGADRVARAEALNSTVREIYETLAWRYADSDTDADELASMRRVIAEAQAHLDRMRAQSTAH